MQSPNKHTTSGGHEYEVKPYASARDWNAIQEIYLTNAKVKLVGKDVQVDGFDPASDFKAKEKAIELLVVSFEGSNENVLKRIMEDLPYKEVEEIHTVLDEVLGKKKTE